MSQRNAAVTDQLGTGAEAAGAEDCPLPEVLALIGGKWSAQVLVELGHGPRRFTQLERAIEDIREPLEALTAWARRAAPVITAARRDYDGRR